MIKAILFDLDGVLTLDKSGSVSTCKYLSQKTGIDYDFLISEYRKYTAQLLDGKVTHKDIWNAFCENVGKDIDMDLLKQSFVNTPIDEKMEALAFELKGKCKIGLITNNMADRVLDIIKHNNWNDLFDAICISSELHSGKEDEEIFRFALECLELPANECVFIDNQEKNLNAPRQMGMKIVFFDDKLRNYEKIEKLLLNIRGNKLC